MNTLNLMGRPVTFQNISAQNVSSVRVIILILVYKINVQKINKYRGEPICKLGEMLKHLVLNIYHTVCRTVFFIVHCRPQVPSPVLNMLVLVPKHRCAALGLLQAQGWEPWCRI